MERERERERERKRERKRVKKHRRMGRVWYSLVTCSKRIV